jgi:uncharacterized membrane protein YphA (DoxX/SURF4 family)
MMNFKESLNWLNTHHDHAYAIIRVYLGLALFIRGLIMLSDPSAITSIAGAQQMYMMYAYVMIGHLVGGFLLAIGFMTRFAALFQIPILAGAVFLIHFGQGLMTVGQSLELAALVLFLLVVYFLFGAGFYSVDHRLESKRSGAVTV